MATTTAAGVGQVPLPKNKSKNRTLGWLTIRRSRSKNKYNLQNAVPHDCQHPDDRPGEGPLGDVDEDDIPMLVERLHMLEAEPNRHDPQIVITTQKHLIDALRRENGALRLLRHQVEHLRRENTALKKDVEKMQVKNKVTNGGKSKNGLPSIEKEAAVDLERELTEDIASLKTENEKLRKSNDQLQNCLEEQHRKHTGVANNGLTNGNLTEGSNGTMDEEKQNGKLSPRGVGMEGGGGGDGKRQLPTLKRGNDNGAGTSGTSLVTVNCLQKSDNNFYDCDEVLEERLKAHMAAKGVDLAMKEWSPGHDHHMVTLVHCLASNNLTKSIMKALDGVSDDAEVILVVYHMASQDTNRKDPETESLNLPALSNACLVVDIFFSKRESLYRCTQNNRAMSRLLHLFEMIC